MPEKEKLAQTMRIDLIPDAPEKPTAGKKQRMVIKSSTRARRTKVQTARLQEDSRYNELLQSIYDAALICDMEGNIVDANARAIEFLLYKRAALTEMTVFNVISGADESLIHTLCANLEEERFTLIQAYCRRKNATIFPAEIAVNKLNLGKMHLCFFVRDITWRRQAEAMLRTEHNAIKNSYNGIAVVDIESKLEYVNPAVARMWGYEGSEDLIETDIRDLLCDMDQSSEMIGTIMGDGEAWNGELRAAARDGREFDVAVSAVCNRNSDGDIVGAVFSLTDISDRKAAEAANRENEKHRVMLESLGAACHYLGQPATVLLANLGILQNKVNTDDESVQKLLDSSIDAVKSLGKTLRKLNAVNEYKTTHYLGDEANEGEQSRILEI